MLSERLRGFVRRGVLATPGLRTLRQMTRRSTLKTRRINGFVMHLDINDGGIGNALFRRGQRELCFMHILKTELKPGMVAVDLGANIGYTTLYMCNGVGPDGKVYAFEPDPRNLTLLKKNIDANNLSEIASIHRMAISNISGEAKFYIGTAPNLSSMTRSGRTISEIETRIESLTTFFGSRNVIPSFIKMDVEGHEVEILDGAYTLFKDAMQNVKILMEVHPASYSDNHSLAVQIRRYLGIGFHTKYVVSTPVAQPTMFRELGYSPIMTIPTDGRVRAIYNDISDEDAIQLACFPHCEVTPEETSAKIVRSIMLEKVE